MTLNVNPNNLFSKKTTQLKTDFRQFYDIVYLRQPLLESLIMVKKYYRENIVYLDSTSVLASILFNIDLGLDVSDKQYVGYLESRTDSLSRSLNITSSFNYGKIFSNEFYSDREILLLDTRRFNIDIANQYWENLAPVYPLLHPWSDIDYTLPIGGKINTANNGLSVINVNIGLLAYQFRAFLKNHMKENEPLNTTIPIFLSQYVLPNMLNKQIDIAIFNILMNEWYQRPNSRSLEKMPFPLPIHQYMNKIKNMCKDILKWISNGRTLLYTQMLEGIPSLYEDNMAETFQMPDIANTRQVWWAVELARLNITLFLIDIGGKESIAYNRSYLSELQKDLSYLQSEKIYSKMFDRQYAEKINEKINYIRSI